MITVLIADDHNLVRAGIRALLEKLDDMDVIAEAEDGLVAVEQAEQLQPDIVIMDFSMPRLNGHEALARIRHVGINCKVIILSMHSDNTIVRHSLETGAQGYLLKSALEDELALAIRKVMAGEIYLCADITTGVIDDYLEMADQLAEPNPIEILTARERQLLQLIAEGRTNREAANIMHIGERTVEKHRSNLMEKLDIHDVAGLVRIAIKHGLISLDN